MEKTRQLGLNPHLIIFKESLTATAQPLFLTLRPVSLSSLMRDTLPYLLKTGFEVESHGHLSSRLSIASALWPYKRKTLSHHFLKHFPSWDMKSKKILSCLVASVKPDLMIKHLYLLTGTKIYCHKKLSALTRATQQFRKTFLGLYNQFFLYSLAKGATQNYLLLSFFQTRWLHLGVDKRAHLRAA